MTKYDELAYLYSAVHKQECCGFADFLAEKLATYMECSREKIIFTTSSGASDNCTEAVIKEIRKGFVRTTIAIILPDEQSRGSTALADIWLQKDHGHFLVRIDHRVDTYLLLKEDNIEMSKFCEALFNIFIDRQTR